MIILETRIRHARRDRDFGRVEAMVDLIIKQTGHPARRVTLRTNQPIHGDLPLRQRLTQDAALLARKMETAHTISVQPARAA